MTYKLTIEATFNDSKGTTWATHISDIIGQEQGVTLKQFNIAPTADEPHQVKIDNRTTAERQRCKDPRLVWKGEGASFRIDVPATLEKLRTSADMVVAVAWKRGTAEHAVKRAILSTEAKASRDALALQAKAAAQESRHPQMPAKSYPMPGRPSTSH